MYYSSCDRLESNIDALPEDAVPDDLNFQPLDEQLPTGHVSKQVFVDWMQLGRHDCDVAKAIGYAWTENLKGSGGETLGEFYDRLLVEREENENDWPEANNQECPHDELSVPWLARFIHAQIGENLAFSLDGDSLETRLSALSDKIAQEMQSVQGYVNTWRTGGVMTDLPKANIERGTREHVATHLFPWPQILDEPTKERSDGRFVKAFPLVFPMGVAD